MSETVNLDEPPADYLDLGFLVGMDNLTHRIDAGFADRLRAEMVYGHHAGQHFNGRVWWDGAQYREAVDRFGAHQQTFAADTLEDLMRAVNDEWGWT